MRDQTIHSEFTSKPDSLRLILDQNNQDFFKRKDKPTENEDPLTPFFPPKEVEGPLLMRETMRGRVKTEPIHQLDLYSVQEMSEEPSEPQSLAQSNVEVGGVDSKNQRLSFRRTNTSFNANDWQQVQCKAVDSAPISTRRPTVTYQDQLAEIKSIIESLIQLKFRVNSLTNYSPKGQVVENLASSINMMQQNIELQLSETGVLQDKVAIDPARLQSSHESPTKALKNDPGAFENHRLAPFCLSDCSVDQRPPETYPKTYRKIEKSDNYYQNQPQNLNLGETILPQSNQIVPPNKGDLLIQQPRLLFNYSNDHYELNDNISLTSY